MGDGLRVEKGTLKSFGNDMITKASELNGQMDILNSNMDKVREVMLSDEGTQVAGNYSSFITDAKKINADLTTLGQHAIKMSTTYDDIESKYASMMG